MIARFDEQLNRCFECGAEFLDAATAQHVCRELSFEITMPWVDDGGDFKVHAVATNRPPAKSNGKGKTAKPWNH